MTGLPDWTGIQLVVFDVDGTLYDQRVLRARMACELGADAMARRSLETISVLRIYRRLREQAAEQELEDFEEKLLDSTAADTGTRTSAVRAIVHEWIQVRPLRHLARCRYPHLQQLFRALASAGKLVGVLSDYPALEKLQALELQAHHVVDATDPSVRVLKPHPRGLTALMARAGASPSQTVLIGDRASRDGMAAQRAGAWPLIRSSRPQEGWPTFARYDSPLFAPLLTD